MPCCAAINCSNKPEKGFRLFRFPANALRQAKWLQNMRRDNWTPISTSRLCEIHFEDLQFEKHRADGWRKLKPTAIPTLFDVPNPPAKIDQSRKSLYKVPKTERRNGKKKDKADFVEESEDPSSENVSTGSGESNVVGTDDDDLEKKIQAFAIPVKKENVISVKNENAIVNVRINKSDVLENHGERSKNGKKVYMKKEKVGAESETKATGNKQVPALEIAIVSSGTRKKKEKQNKTKNKCGDEEKQLSVEKSCLTSDQQILQNFDKSSQDTKNVAIKSSEQRLKNEEGEEEKSISSVKKKVKVRSQQDVSESVFEILQIDVTQKDEKSPVPVKTIHDKRNNAEMSKELTSATVAKKKNLKNTERKRNVDATKKTKLNGKSPSLLSNKYIKTTRKSRISSISNKRPKISESTSHDSTACPEGLHVAKNAPKKVLKNIKYRIDNSLKKDKSIVGVKTKESPSEKTSAIERKRKSTHDSVTTKDGKRQQKRQKLIDVTNNNDETSVLAEKGKISSNKAQNLPKKPTPGPKSQTNSSDVLDDGDEELLEKIMDILEDSCKIIDTAEKRNSMSYKLLPYVQNTDSLSKKVILTNYPSIFKAKLLQKHTKFPPDSKGTVPYQKLWKWSHYVKMPSDMWSLHKHPNGDFVVVFHISEMSPFPDLIIDKCVLFKETASPCVKIYGKDVLALSSENELITLGNVCTFLKHIHNISLCDGISTAGESSNNCELYTDEKVSMPFKCKYCQSNS